jgi:hypothetical protein
MAKSKAPSTTTLPKSGVFPTQLSPIDSGAHRSVKHSMDKSMTALSLGSNHAVCSWLISSPRCPQIYSPPELWIEETFPKTASQPREYTWDEFRCTNLNIVFPAGALQNDPRFQNVPVMVNIHGNSTSTELHKLTRTRRFLQSRIWQ